MSFARKDYKVRYAQTYLGYWWSLVQPIVSVAVLFIIFQKMISVPTEGVAYLPFALSGLVLWNYFSYIITQSASAMVNAQHMIRKIYFPRLCLPLSRTLVGLVEPLVGLVLLSGIMVYAGEGRLLAILFIPIPLLLTAMAALGAGVWISGLSLRYRDLQQILPFVLQLIFFLTPVAYSTGLMSDMINPQWKWILYLNPMTGIIELFRSVLFGSDLTGWAFISFAISVLIFLFGLRYFQKVEMKIADIL